MKRAERESDPYSPQDFQRPPVSVSTQPNTIAASYPYQMRLADQVRETNARDVWPQKDQYFRYRVWQPLRDDSQAEQHLQQIR